MRHTPDGPRSVPSAGCRAAALWRQQTDSTDVLGDGKKGDAAAVRFWSGAVSLHIDCGDVRTP